ncbi:hypothetical protein KY289_013300 [Solanum tuberosum]|nr:hypothetical protein KY289_013300 [Solanum tuberosum]
MKGNFSSMSQLVDSQTTSIKQTEQQLGKLSASLNQRKNRSLLSDTIKNPKKDGHCMAITTKSDEAEQVDDLEDAQPIAKPARANEKEDEGTMPLQ